MSLRDTVWTDYGQGMHNATRCTRPAHSLTTLLHRSRVTAHYQDPPQLNINTPRKPKPRPAPAAPHYLGAAQLAVEQTAGAI